MGDLVQEFPPTSKLDPIVYGNQHSSIRSHHIEEHLDGSNVEEQNYATRTLHFLQQDGVLKPVAIELSLPHNDKLGAISRVCTPAKLGVEAEIWKLAKTYVAVNDSRIHQLISHWLNTRAVIEPFVIATNRQLSVLHPIYKLLHPHFHDTMNINASARNILINRGGVIERTFFTGKYSIELCSKIYKNNWVKLREMKPGTLSHELKEALGMPDGAPPPWLINMQVFTNNMGTKSEPTITKCKNSKNWTMVSFKPDLSKFRMECLEEDVVALMKKRVVDLVACLGKTVKVELDGKRVPPKTFEDYFSFVNNIATIKGGTHVDYITNQIANHLVVAVKKQNKHAILKAHNVKNYLWVFVNALIDNPAFDSQIKETLTIKQSSFGSTCELSPEFLKKVAKFDIVKKVFCINRLGQATC